MRSQDRTAKIVVTASAIVMVVGTLAGLGLLGTRVEESPGGAFAADATLLTPATTAFSIWSLIYLGLAAYVVWQWLPAASARTARIAWPAAISMVLNALWLGVSQFGWVWASVVVILALVVDLGIIVRRLDADAPDSLAERLVVDGTFGLYLGWVSVATVANITAALVSSGFQLSDLASEVLAVAVLAVAAALGGVFSTRLGARWSVALAMAWALGWIAVGRLAGEPASVITGLAAAAAAVVILAANAFAARGKSAARPDRS